MPYGASVSGYMEYCYNLYIYAEIKLLSLAELQERCIILLRVDLFSRSSDLTRLFREQIVFTKDGCKVRFFKPKEWRAQGKLTMKEWTAWINMAKVTGHSSICPVMVLEQWLHRSRDIAPKETVDGKVQTNLFFTKMAQGTVKMEASQVAKVAKNYLARAGVPDKYTAQSIRAAASSAAVDDGTSSLKSSPRTMVNKGNVY